MKEEKLWNRDFTLITLAGFFAALVVYTLLTTMAVYSMRTYGIGEGLAGFAASSIMIGSITGRLLTGAWENRIGRRRLAILVTLLQIVFCFFYLVPMGLGAFIALRILHGITSGSIQNITASAVIDFIPPARRAEGINVNSLCFVAAIALGPSLGLLIINEWSYTVHYTICIGYAALAAVFILFVRFVPLKPFEAQQAQPRGKAGLWKVFEKSALPLAFMIVLLSICYNTIMTFLETYTLQIGIAWAASVFFIVYSVGVVVSRPLSGRLMDRRGENSIMVPSIIIYIATFVALGLAGVVTGMVVIVLLIVAAVTAAFGFGVILPSGQAVAVKYSETDAISRSISTYYSFFDIGMAVGAFIMGTVASMVGFSNMFFAAILFVLASFIIYWQFHGRRHRVVK